MLWNLRQPTPQRGGPPHAAEQLPPPFGIDVDRTVHCGLSTQFDDCLWGKEGEVGGEDGNRSGPGPGTVHCRQSGSSVHCGQSGDEGGDRPAPRRLLGHPPNPRRYDQRVRPDHHPRIGVRDRVEHPVKHAPPTDLEQRLGHSTESAARPAREHYRRVVRVVGHLVMLRDLRGRWGRSDDPGGCRQAEGPVAAQPTQQVCFDDQPGSHRPTQQVKTQAQRRRRISSARYGSSKPSTCWARSGSRPLTISAAPAGSRLAMCWAS